jgi:hypothetical protein
MARICGNRLGFGDPASQDDALFQRDDVNRGAREETFQISFQLANIPFDEHFHIEWLPNSSFTVIEVTPVFSGPQADLGGGHRSDVQNLGVKAINTTSIRWKTPVCETVSAEWRFSSDGEITCRAGSESREAFSRGAGAFGAGD